MTRVLPTENLLETEPHKKKPKIRNYSFRASKRLPSEKMTEVNGIKIPSMPGSCYHAIIAGLAQNKDKFCPWDKILQLTQQNMRMYGGQNAWDRFIKKSNVKTYQQRIKDNTHTLTRKGRDCYGFRLHEQGMAIYYFKDGAMLITGGQLEQKNGAYEVNFPDAKTLQTRYRGTTMTYREYKRFLEKNYITQSGKILDPEGIKRLRSEGILKDQDVVLDGEIHVCVVLGDTFNQHTAIRLEKMGLKVEQGFGNELIGVIVKSKLEELRTDSDVAGVEVSGE